MSYAASAVTTITDTMCKAKFDYTFEYLNFDLLPATGAGSPEAIAEWVAILPIFTPIVSPGGGGGCVGSPC